MNSHLPFFHKWFISLLLLLLLLQQVVGQQDDDNVDDKKVAQKVFIGVTLVVLLCWMTWKSIQWSKQRRQERQAFVAYEQELQEQIQRASSAMHDQDPRPPPIPYQTYLVQASTTTNHNEDDHDSRPIRTGEWRMQFVPLDNGCYRITGRGKDDNDGDTTIVHGLCGPTGSPAYWKEERLHRRVVARLAPLSGTMLRLSPKHVISKGSFDFASGTFSDGTWKNQVPSSPTEFTYDTPMQGIYGPQQVTVRLVLASDDDEENQPYQPPTGLLMEQPVA